MDYIQFFFEYHLVYLYLHSKADTTMMCIRIKSCREVSKLHGLYCKVYIAF